MVAYRHPSPKLGRGKTLEERQGEGLSDKICISIMNPIGVITNFASPAKEMNLDIWDALHRTDN
jgi:hypothetical protein